MEQILSRPRYRVMFFAIVILGAAVDLLVRFLWLPHFNSKLWVSHAEFLAILLDNVFASLVATVALGSFMFCLTPPVMRRAKVEPVEPGDIRKVLMDAARTSDRWYFRGSVARYTRATTLPLMAEAARGSNSRREITIQLLDPGDRAICRQYANYRQGMNSASSEGEAWTEARVRREVVATILRAYMTKGLEPMLSVSVVLTKWFSSFRLDLSSRHVIITKEDPRAPAIRSDYGSYFYEAYLDDLLLTSRQGRQLQGAPKDFDPAHVSINDLRGLLAHLQIDANDLTDDEMGEAIRAAELPQDPYK